MSNCPTIEQILDIRDRLASAVKDCAAREQALNQAFSVRADAGKKERAEAVQEERDTTATLVSEQDTALAEQKAALAKRCEHRERWIRRAYESSRKSRRHWIEGAEGRRKNKIQIALMQAERVHEEDLESEREASLRRKESRLSAVKEFRCLERRVRRCFLGYAGCIRLTPEADGLRDHDGPGEYDVLMASVRQWMESIGSDLVRFRKLRLPAVSRFFSLWVLVPLLLVCLATAVLASYAVFPIPANVAAWAWLGTALGCVLCVVHLWGRRQAAPVARAVAQHLDAVRTLLSVCGRQENSTHRQLMADIEDTYEQTVAGLERQWKEPSTEDAPALLAQSERELKAKSVRLMERHQRVSQRRGEALDAAFRARVEALRGESDARVAAWQAEDAARREAVEAEFAEQWRALEEEWQKAVHPLYADVKAATEAAEALFPDWASEQWSKWTPPREFAGAVEFARLNVDLEALGNQVPQDARLVLPGPARFSLPISLTFPEEGSLLFETRTACRDSVLGALNNIMLRLLSVAPPGKVAFTILDPVELGQNFAGIMHLADYEESIVTRRIWTQPRQIEERLADLNEHMEKVIQMYLRNEYDTIADYNQQAGDIAEKYHFVVVADFPANFSELAARRLFSIAASGPRCGVYLLLHWDQRRPVPQDFVPDELRKNMVRLGGTGRDFVFPGRDAKGAEVVLNAPPDAARATEFMKKVGRRSIDSNRIEVPFSHVTPGASRLWSLDTSEELRVPIGRTGATKLQYLALGKGTKQHVLIAGKTGSGKSTLFHALISNLALWCSPEQVEFYLVDFKKGVEFKCYATRQLPHARVVAIESDREFGLSVLERVDEELKRRGDLFRELGVQDLGGYKKSSGGKLMPRTLLIVDEFQEFFVQDDSISQAASLLLDRIVRQGRAFGIHVLLGSQTLGGAYTLARATLGQMTIRIALQCNETDAFLIMDDDNSAPRLLSRPGEAIYNDAAGRMEGNSPFQVVWLNDDERDRHLDTVCKLANRENADRSGPVVFEGNAPADVTSNVPLRKLLAGRPDDVPGVARIWLGEPNRIKGPTEVGFMRQSGNNLLVVGQRDEAVLATLGVAIVALAAQHPAGQLRLIVIDASLTGSAQRKFLEHVGEAVPHEIRLAGSPDIPSVVNELWQEMGRRNGDDGAVDAVPTFVFIHGIQKYKRLRFEEDFGFSATEEDAAPDPGSQLNELICEGSGVGIHLIVTCDTYSNLGRWLSRKAIGEFEMRVLFQMSQNDSANLIDSPAASQLGLHRALFHNEQQGYTELYRPYALPDSAWLEDVARRTAARKP